MDTLFLFCFCAGLGLVIILLGLKRKPLLRSGALGHYWCPNVVSLLGIPFCWIGYLVCWVIWENIYLAMLIYSFGVATDLMDGRMARYHSITHPHEGTGTNFLSFGKSNLGAVVDPLADKARVVPIFIQIAFAAWGEGMLVVSSLFLLIAGVEIWAGIKRIRQLQNQNEEELKANGWGKLKAVLQHAVLAPWVTHAFFQNIVLTSILIGLLIVIFILTVASPISRMRRNRAKTSSLLESRSDSRMM